MYRMLGDLSDRKTEIWNKTLKVEMPLPTQVAVEGYSPGTTSFQMPGVCSEEGGGWGSGWGGGGGRWWSLELINE